MVEPGVGRITLVADGNAVLLSELSSSYPLKLLSPRLPPQNVALVYSLTYGGGLVAGDRVALHVEVNDRAILVILTQVCPLLKAISQSSIMTAIAPFRALRKCSRHGLDSDMPVHISKPSMSSPLRE